MGMILCRLSLIGRPGRLRRRLQAVDRLLVSLVENVGSFFVDLAKIKASARLLMVKFLTPN